MLTCRSTKRAQYPAQFQVFILRRTFNRDGFLKRRRRLCVSSYQSVSPNAIMSNEHLSCSIYLEYHVSLIFCPLPSLPLAKPCFRRRSEKASGCHCMKRTWINQNRNLGSPSSSVSRVQLRGSLVPALICYVHCTGAHFAEKPIETHRTKNLGTFFQLFHTPITQF